jgi:sugar/nucleoside kinase (ribokinase family)
LFFSSCPSTAQPPLTITVIGQALIDLNAQTKSVGGTANNTGRVIRHLTRQRNEPVICHFWGTVGRDENGDLFKRLLIRQSISWHGWESPGATGLCEVTDSGTDRTFNVIPGVSLQIDLEGLRKFLMSQKPDLLILEGFLLSSDAPFSWDQLLDAIQSVEREKILFLLPCAELIRNIGPERLREILHQFACITGNEEELSALLNISDRKGLCETLGQLSENNDSMFRMTCGSNGAYTFSAGKTYFHKPKQVENPRCASGAGDVYTGAFEFYRLQGVSIEECGQNACKLAAQHVSGQSFLQSSSSSRRCSCEPL